MSAPVFRPVRRVDPRTGLTFKSGTGRLRDVVADACHLFRSKTSRKDDRWFVASFNNTTPKLPSP